MHILCGLHRCDGRPLPELRRRTHGPPAAREDVNYRHAYHAGNFADVIKHVALVAILQHLKKKDKPFRAIDTHAGGGLYDLSGSEATRTGEADAGIARIRDLTGPPALAEYLAIVRSLGEGKYPGSPLIAARMLRPDDRMIAIEKHPEEFAALKKNLAVFATTRVAEADGYEQLKALLPPPERRGLVLIDPPYESEDEFERAAQALIESHRRFATGIFMLWFPIKSAADANAFTGEIANTGVEKLLRVDIDVGTQPGPDKERLSAASLLIVNPPFGFADEMRAVAGVLAPALGRGKAAAITVNWLAGGEAQRMACHRGLS
jgi:23S rRNA (adenine2030-N6)-methyltransferase